MNGGLIGAIGALPDAASIFLADVDCGPCGDGAVTLPDGFPIAGDMGGGLRVDAVRDQFAADRRHWVFAFRGDLDFFAGRVGRGGSVGTGDTDFSH